MGNCLPYRGNGDGDENDDDDDDTLQNNTVDSFLCMSQIEEEELVIVYSPSERKRKKVSQTFTLSCRQ